MITATLFHYCKGVDDDYYYGVDSMLMYGSKGGITLDTLIGRDKVLGQKTKEKYMKAFQRLYAEINKKPESSNESVDGVDIPAGNFSL